MLRLIPLQQDRRQQWWMSRHKQISKADKKGFDSFVMLICWTLWKQRNARVFQLGVIAMSMLWLILFFIMKNGNHPVSNSCPSLLFASKKLLTTVQTFFPFFDCNVSTSFRNPVWTVEIRRTTCLYVQNMKATMRIHQMRHTIIRDYLLKNIVITS